MMIATPLRATARHLKTKDLMNASSSAATLGGFTSRRNCTTILPVLHSMNDDSLCNKCPSTERKQQTRQSSHMTGFETSSFRRNVNHTTLPVLHSLNDDSLCHPSRPLTRYQSRQSSYNALGDAQDQDEAPSSCENDSALTNDKYLNVAMLDQDSGAKEIFLRLEKVGQLVDEAAM